MSQNYNFKLSFKGELIDNSVDAYDVANTILATTQILREIAEIKYGAKAAASLNININAFEKGSLITDFLILAKDTATETLFPAVGTAYAAGKEILGAYKNFVEVKKILKGKEPKEIKPVDQFTFQITADNGATVNVNIDGLRVLQSRTINKNATKAVSPLLKDGSQLEEIDIIAPDEEDLIITKDDSQYICETEGSQSLDRIKYKGVISKVDTKARSGFIEIRSKRLSFYYDDSLPKEKFALLIESLRNKIQIYLVGSVIMDYENNPLNMKVNDVESDVTMF
jgi:hypothetical protein